MGRKLDLTSSPLPPPFLAVVTALQNFTQKNQISRKSREEKEMETIKFSRLREISFSTLNFSLESETLINAWLLVTGSIMVPVIGLVRGFSIRPIMGLVVGAMI